MAIDPITGAQIPDLPAGMQPTPQVPTYDHSTDPVYGTRPTTSVITPAAPGPSGLEALDIGATAGTRAVLNFPSYITGGAIPAVPTRPEEQVQQAAAQRLHPNWYSTGQTIGEAAPTTLAMGAAEAAAPAFAVTAPIVRGIQAASRFNPLVRLAPGYTSGTVGGIVGNVLTGADSPNEPLLQRVETGLWGGPIGALTHGLGTSFAGPGLASQQIQNDARLMQGAGVDVDLGNLPLAGARGTATRGLAASLPQRQQMTTAIAEKYLNEPGVTDFAQTNPATAALNTKLGQAVDNVARTGAVDNTPTLQAETAKALHDTIATGDADATNKIQKQFNNIWNQFRAAGGTQLPGDQYAALTNWRSPLAKMMQDANPYVRDGARALDAALDKQFAATSPGVAPLLGQAKSRYALMQAITDNVDPNGIIQPQNLYKDIQSHGPGAMNLAGDFGRAAWNLYGTRTTTGSQAPPGMLRTMLGFAGGATAAEVAGNLLMHGPVGTLAGAMEHSIIVGVPAAAAAAGAGWRWLGHQFQTPNRLIARGIQAGGNALAPYAGMIGSEAMMNPYYGGT